MAMDLQRLMSLLRQCMQRYDMVSAGDKIAVGLSGGKDSLTLLMAGRTPSGSIPCRTGCARFTSAAVRRAARQTWRRCGDSAKN